MQLVVIRNNDMKPPTMRKRLQSHKSIITASVVGTATPYDRHESVKINPKSDGKLDYLSEYKMQSANIPELPQPQKNTRQEHVEQNDDSNLVTQEEILERGLKKIQNMPQKKRDRFSLISSGTSVKMKKMSITTENGTPVLNVNLKSWDIRRFVDLHLLTYTPSRHLLMEDMRPKFSKTRNMDLIQTNPDIKVYSLFVAGGPLMGTLELVNPMKLIITPASNLNQLFPKSGRGSDLEDSAHNSLDVQATNFNFCLSGNLSEGSWIVIMKSTVSRVQRLVGESRGRQLTRRNVRESKWTTSFEFEDHSIYSQLLLSAVCFLTAGLESE